jgi:Polyketide cyclase / dehydrase and lipid transport
MFKKILLVAGGVLVAGVAITLALAATQPDVFQVQRSTNIKATPEKIHPLINDLRAFNRWSPYEQKDPAMKRSYSGPESGKGAAYAWDGNKEVGKGQITIADTSPSKITLNLDMHDPFEAHNVVAFTLVPVGDSTKVTWAMQGKMPYLAKIMCLFFDMDKMVGGDFANGLANLKAIAEK